MKANPSKQQGSVIISYTMMLLPLVIAAFLTITIGYQVLITGRAAQAADAAALACKFEGGTSDSTLTRYYSDYYQPKFTGVGTVTANSMVNSDCQVSINYSLVKNLMLAFGFSGTSPTARAEAKETADIENLTAATPTEIVLVLDVSSSMLFEIDNLKQILKDAVISLEEQQINANDSNYIRVAIVPFSDGVSVNDAPWLGKNGLFCVNALVERGGKVQITETVNNIDTTHDALPVEHAPIERFLADCSESPTLPLTSDLSKVRDDIAGMDVSGGTYSYQGLIWGIRQLTPNWQKAWNIDIAYQDKEADKKLILLTDGSDNDSRFDELQQAGLCQRITEDFNIELSFIGFGVNDSRIAQFERCTGDPDTVFSAKNTQDLEKYFSQLMQIDHKTVLKYGNK